VVPPEFVLQNDFRLLLVDGTVTRPSVAFSLDRDTGFYSSTNGEVAVSSQGVKVAAFDEGGLLPTWEVDDSTEAAGPVALDSTTSEVLVSVTLAIPTTWASHKIEAYATLTRVMANNATPAGTVFLWIDIEGTDQQTHNTTRVSNSGGDIGVAESVGGRRTGMTSTGNVTVALEGKVDAGSVNCSSLYIFARAVRTS
jgi:hypothetical protein